MTITEEQVYKEFFNNESIYINVFYYEYCNYLSKDKFELLIKFLNQHKNNLSDGFMKDLFNSIRNEINSLITDFTTYIQWITNFNQTQIKQFCYYGEVINTSKIASTDNISLIVQKLIKYEIIKTEQIGFELENQINNLDTKLELKFKNLEYYFKLKYEKLEDKYKKLEDKYLNLKKKNLEIESVIEIFKSYYEHKYNSLYNYEELKKNKQLLHKEFYVVAKLMKLNK